MSSDRIREINRKLNLREEVLKSGNRNNRIHSIELDNINVATIKKMVAAAELLGLDCVLQTSGDWLEGGEHVFGKMSVIIKGSKFYSDVDSTGKMSVAEPDSRSSKLRLELYKK